MHTTEHVTADILIPYAEKDAYCQTRTMSDVANDRERAVMRYFV